MDIMIVSVVILFGKMCVYIRKQHHHAAPCIHSW